MKLLIAITFMLTLLAQAAPASAQDGSERAETLRRTGEYAAALELIEAELGAGSDDSGLVFLAGELHLAIGETDAAAEYFGRLADGADGDLMSAARLAGIYQQHGERAQAEALWRRIRDSYQSRASLSARDLHAIADATRELGRSDPQLFHEAVRLYDDAIRRDPSATESGIALGALLLEKYNNEEALQVFTEVLDRDDGNPHALLGLARSQHFDYSAEAMETALRALEINPRLVGGRAFLARL